MKTLTVMIVMIGLLVTSTLVQAANPAPDWILTSSAGEATRLSAEVRQQPVILFFWATWCPYCKALMPHLQSIRLEHGQNVKILAISFVEKGDPAGFVKEQGYDFTVLPDGDDVASIYGVYGTPGVFLIDQDQQIRFDLRYLPPPDVPESAGKSSHKQKAAYIAPYWAAELRKSIDSVLDESAQ